MAKYRKKPVMIEARQYLPNFMNGDIAKWCGGSEAHNGDTSVLLIETLEGTMTACSGDWIIQGVEGEFYPCKSSIFEKTYELADGFISEGEANEA